MCRVPGCGTGIASCRPMGKCLNTIARREVCVGSCMVPVCYGHEALTTRAPSRKREFGSMCGGYAVTLEDDGDVLACAASVPAPGFSEWVHSCAAKCLRTRRV